MWCTGVLSRLLWNVPSLLMLLQMLALYPLTFLEREFFSRGVWVCFSILFSESTQLLKTCLNRVRDPRCISAPWICQEIGRQARNWKCGLSFVQLQSGTLGLWAADHSDCGGFPVYSKMPAILTATILTLTILFLFCVVLGSKSRAPGFFAKAFC